MEQPKTTPLRVSPHSLMVLTPDQEAAVAALYEVDAKVLVAGTGVGKTVVTETAIYELIEAGELRRVIVAAPPKVIETLIWEHEAAKWPHLRGLRILTLAGTSQQRTKALLTSGEGSHILMVSLNNLEWLLAQDHECDGIVIDELSKATGKQSAGLKSKKKSEMLKWRIGLTATPVSQNFEKIWAMCRILDHGEALGRNKQHYMEEHFYADFQGFNWAIKAFADATILNKVKHLIHMIPDNKAATLPGLTEVTVNFDMPSDTRDVYNEMKKHMVTDDREAANQAVKSGVLRQIASGFTYTDDDNTVIYDMARETEVDKWITGLGGRPGLIFYEFVHQALWAGAAPDNITFAQIQSMSHGIDGLQYEYADVLFVQPVWSRDSYEQAVGRVHRQGQMKPVTVTTLCCNNTLDELVMARVEDRGQWMELFKQHLKN
jgi:hypothetical protein